jgi:hypothetical protein
MPRAPAAAIRPARVVNTASAMLAALHTLHTVGRHQLEAIAVDPAAGTESTARGQRRADVG